MEDVALFLHLLGALLFVSGIVLAGVPFELARRHEEAAAIAVLLGLARVGAVLVLAGAVLLLAFGLWLVHLSGAGFDAAWVQAALGLFLLALALGAIGGQRPKQARLRAAELAARGAAVDEELRALLADPTSRALNYASAALVVAILALMVFKP